MNFYRLLAAFAVAACFHAALPAAPARAQAQAQAKSERATVAEVEELVRILKVDRLITAMLPQVKKQVGGLIKQRVPNILPEHLAAIEKSMNDVMDRMPAEFGKFAVPLYREHLTAEEVRVLTRFYKSPVGSSVIGKLPAITKQAQQFGALLGQKLAREALQGAKKQLQSKGYQL